MKIQTRLLCIIATLLLCAGVAFSVPGVYSNYWYTNKGTTENDTTVTVITPPADMKVNGVCVQNSGDTNNMEYMVNGPSSYTLYTGTKATAPKNWGGKCYDDASVTNVKVSTSNGVTTTYEIEWSGNKTQ